LSHRRVEIGVRTAPVSPAEAIHTVVRHIDRLDPVRLACEPEELVLRDRVLQLLGAAWVATVRAAIALVSADHAGQELICRVSLVMRHDPMAIVVVQTKLRQQCVLRRERLLALSLRGLCAHRRAFTVITHFVLHIVSDRGTHWLARAPPPVMSRAPTS